MRERRISVGARWGIVVAGIVLGTGIVAFLAPGDMAPAFCAPPVEGGKEVCPLTLPHEVLLLSFLEENQETSREAAEILGGLQKRYAKRKVLFFGIMEAGHRIGGIPCLRDSDRRISGRFGVVAYPTTALFDRNNRLIDVFPGKGINFGQQVEHAIRFALGEISEAERRRLDRPPPERGATAQHRAEAFLNFARLSFEQNRLDQAKKLLDRSISLYESAGAYLLYGEILLREGDRARGCEMIRRGIELDPASRPSMKEKCDDDPSHSKPE
ncbi:MAG: hypothetical protein D6795_01340 [Deltaproteobacteria bacterium]|nr:MAG: hypothetical protein D6795_01340 [Deltaproteobacteria bacterium]